MNNRVVVSTIGASLFFNVLDTGPEDQRLRPTLTKAANIPESGLDPELARALEMLTVRAVDRLRKGTPAENRRLSAELNGIYGYYSNNLANGAGDLHFLISTDTAQGQRAARVVSDFLNENGGTCQIPPFKHLSTADTSSFSRGIKSLIGWCEEYLPGYRAAGYQIVFNLAGSFKSLQGFLNTIGMFYADEIVYIFEAESADLIRIPRLPISIDLDEISRHAVGIAMFDGWNDFYPVSNLGDLGVPDMFAEEIRSDGRDLAIMSTWGTLIWRRSKSGLLSRGLLNFPRLTYGKEFEKEFQKASNEERVELQEKLAKVAACLDIDGGDVTSMKSMGDLQYENYTNKRDDKGRPIGHFRLGNSSGRRASCVHHDGQLLLRHFGPHDYVNGNP